MLRSAELAHKRHTKIITKPSRRSRLGYAPFVHPDEETWAARHLFLRAIEEHVPAVLRSLYDDVFPRYKMHDGNYDDAMSRWAVKFNLTVNGDVSSWVDFQAHKTITIWDNYPHTWLHWDTLVPPMHSSMRLPPELDELSIRLLGAGGDGDESLADIRKRLYAEAQAEIDAHLEKVGRHAEIVGLKESKEIRQPEHYVWAVRFQVGGEDVPTIASSISAIRPDGIDEKSVRLPIASVLGMVGLDRRKERPGPKSRKSSGS